MASASRTPPQKPLSTNGIVITGIIKFSAQLSPSFAMFTINRCAFGDDLDVVVRTADGVSTTHLTRIVEEVERCFRDGLPVRVHGWMPFERCCCVESCPHLCIHAWNVNDLVIVDALPSQLLCCLVTPPPPSSSSSEKPNLIMHKEEATPNPKNNDNNNGSRKKTRGHPNNYHRSSRFVEFLVNTFGHKYLGSTSVGVLDVAGGSGGVTFELSLRRGIPSTVIDPRPVKLNKRQRNTLKFRRDSREKLQAGVNVSHLARVMCDRYQEWQPNQMQCLFDEEFALTKEGEELLKNCTCIVGMHPDEATDAIMEMAIRYKKPFAVCPCCVFPTLFTQRRLPNGGFVRSYEDLCSYVANRVDNVQHVILDFEGRNQVLFWVPPKEEG